MLWFQKESISYEEMKIISKLTNLKILFFDNCKISLMPECFTDLNKSLTTLKITSHD